MRRPRSASSAKNPWRGKPTLADCCVDKNLANDARKAAAMTEDKFRAAVDRAILTPTAADADEIAAPPQKAPRRGKTRDNDPTRHWMAREYLTVRQLHHRRVARQLTEMWRRPATRGEPWLF
jgi:hypothetical protein